MNSAREKILVTIRRVNSGRSPQRADDYAGIARDYQQTPEFDATGVRETFAERLRDYGSAIEFCGAGEISAVVSRILSERDLGRLLVPDGVPEEWLPQSFDFIRDNGLSYEAIDSAGGVLTACALAIALTGTIVLRHSADEGRRALTLVPDYHLCVVFESQLVETVPEAVRRMNQFASAPITTISGPSATSDIEMTRVKGVHGPRTLDVIFVLS